MNGMPIEDRVTVLESDFRAMRMLLERIGERMKTLATRDDVATVAKDVSGLSKNLAPVAKNVARLEGRVSQLPTTMVMIGFVFAVLAAGGLTKHLFP